MFENQPESIQPPIRVLFLCLGNICRSPLAEGVFRQQVVQAGLADHFQIDSAGTSGNNAGSLPDPRTRRVATENGLELTHIARQLKAEDLKQFHYLLAADMRNLNYAKELKQVNGGISKLGLLRRFEPGATVDEIPDPYFGEYEGFVECYQIVNASCAGLLKYLREAHQL
jgi:protein-tyrosine phosphatase